MVVFSCQIAEDFSQQYQSVSQRNIQKYQFIYFYAYVSKSTQYTKLKSISDKRYCPQSAQKRNEFFLRQKAKTQKLEKYTGCSVGNTSIIQQDL